MTKTRSYHDYLIQSLQEIEDAAAYIQAILEEKEPEPELLLVVLKDVIKAQGDIPNMTEIEQKNWNRLQQLLKVSGGEEIYCFVDLLKALGLKIEIGVHEDKVAASMISKITAG